MVDTLLVNSSNKCPVSRLMKMKNALVLPFHTVLVVKEEVEEEVGGEEPPDLGSYS